MSKNPDQRHGEMRDEYDFHGGKRGKYADRFARGSNVVVLDPDVAAELKTPKAVNKALREYLSSKRRKSGAA
jgi:hypothetical protein